MLEIGPKILRRWTWGRCHRLSGPHGRICAPTEVHGLALNCTGHHSCVKPVPDNGHQRSPLLRENLGLRLSPSTPSLTSRTTELNFHSLPTNLVTIQRFQSTSSIPYIKKFDELVLPLGRSLPQFFHRSCKSTKQMVSDVVERNAEAPEVTKGHVSLPNKNVGDDTRPTE